MTSATDKPTIVITGCSGFIGEALIARLAQTYTIVGFDVVGPPEGDADFVEFDITSEDSVRAGLEQVRSEYGDAIASVIHLAAFYDFSGAPSPKYREINIEGTGRLLDALQGFEVEQFLFTSTMLVHKPCEPGERIDEDWPLEAKWPYPESKVATEEIIAERRGDIPVLTMRLAGIYNDACNSPPLAHQIQRIFERRVTSHFYPGDTSRGQSFLHQDDLVDAVERAVARRAQLPDDLAMLLGEPDTMAYGDIQDRLGQLIHAHDWTTLRIPKPLAKVGAWVRERSRVVDDPFIKPWMIDRADDHYALDIDCARQTLDWQPRRFLGDTLIKMIEAFADDPVGWYEAHDLELPRSWKDELEGRDRAQAGQMSA